MRRTACALVLTLVVSACGWGFPLTILYTNDLHVRLDRFESLAAAVAQERASGAAVLLLDAGDTWQDHRLPIPNVWGSQPTLAWMNEVSYTAMALGNHDLYFGPRRLAELLAVAEFPVLCANWTAARIGDPQPDASIRLRVGGLSLLVVGLITGEFLPVPAYPHMQYRAPADALRRALQEQKGTFDLVLVVAHLPLDAARALCRAVPDIDVLVSGHSHDATPRPLVEGSSWIVQSGAFGHALGRLRLDVDEATASMSLRSNDLFATERTPADDRAGVRQFLAVAAATLAAVLLWLI